MVPSHYDVVNEQDPEGMFSATIPQMPGFLVEAKSSDGLEAFIRMALSTDLFVAGAFADSTALSMAIEEALVPGKTS